MKVKEESNLSDFTQGVNTMNSLEFLEKVSESSMVLEYPKISLESPLPLTLSPLAKSQGPPLFIIKLINPEFERFKSTD